MALSRRVDLGVRKLKIFCKVRTMNMNSGSMVGSSPPPLMMQLLMKVPMRHTHVDHVPCWENLLGINTLLTHTKVIYFLLSLENCLLARLLQFTWFGVATLKKNKRVKWISCFLIFRTVSLLLSKKAYCRPASLPPGTCPSLRASTVCWPGHGAGFCKKL